MPIVVVTGAATPLGRRVLARFAATTGTRVVAVDEISADLKRTTEGADALVHLGDADDAREVFEAAGAAAVEQVVVASTASVYGGWPDNSVPLTEEAPIRPNPGFDYATHHAEAERLAAEHREAHPGVRVAVLRFAPVLVPGEETWESRTLASPPALRADDAVPPAQFLHVEDAASAVEHAVTAALDGTFNVAPDGFVAGETARALAGGGISIPVPDRLGRSLARLAWRLGLGSVTPTAEPYRTQPWVVANDRFRATGWRPAYSNEEALVATRKGSWWRELSPKRRQEVALAVSGAGLVAVGAALVVLVRGARRRRATR
ncbi:MAG TPA: NAD-dependent epimerase/dehydratase family protein [Acidimicrobiales bacterium]|nr:NAD-dependent epimerase/dehydratase family protein [Acidimicrobiales bacterium]